MTNSSRLHILVLENYKPEKNTDIVSMLKNLFMTLDNPIRNPIISAKVSSEY